ncbi:hypothetical protein HMPREF2992_02535 [Prevotella sp. HMSC069G02]|nr:hypothetical protein HMPREF2992_02535 [Prevotella sp. HMSC069G02]
MTHQKKGEIKVYKQLKYRCEQSVTTYLNDVPASNVQTKADYTLQGIEDTTGHKAYRVKIDENIISMFPEQFSEAAKMMGDLEAVKSDVVRILNHEEVLSRWEDYKQGMREKYEFLQDKQIRDNMEGFLNIVGKQIANESALLAELQLKLPFLLLFDKHLVSSDISASTEQQEFSSPLFDHITFPLELRQEIVKETPTEILFTRHNVATEIPKDVLKRIEEIYNQKYKPTVGYSFSTYNVDYGIRFQTDREGVFLREAQGSITEEVVNNTRLAISFTLRKIQ